MTVTQPAPVLARARVQRTRDSALVLWRTSRPAIWLTSVVPFYVGHLLATHQVWPSFRTLTATLDAMARHGLTGHQFWAAQGHALHQDGRLLLSFLVVGPLFWSSSLLVNDAYDVPGDLVNPRKADAPLVLGVVTARWATAASFVAAALALGLSCVVSWGLALVTLALLVGSYAYSMPPLRLKTRPGADVVSNALGVGVLPLLGGYGIARSVTDFPWVVLALGLLVATALYVPTTLVDHEADAAVGYTTCATVLGPRVAYRLAWWCWVGANALALVLAATSHVFPHRMLWFLVPGVPVLLLEHRLLIGRPGTGLPVLRGLVVLSWTFLVVNAAFVLFYGRLWV